MSEHIRIGDIAPRVHYVADGVQTAFTYPFPIFEPRDIEVLGNNAPANYGYVVEGAGQSGGGTIRYAEPPAAGTRLTILRRLAFERVVLPVLEAFRPDFLIVSAGFDASYRDPLAQMSVTPAGFGWLAAALDRVHTTDASRKTMYVLEGGYDLVGLEESLLASLHGARGAAYDAAPTNDPGLMIATAARSLKSHWSCLER